MVAWYWWLIIVFICIGCFVGGLFLGSKKPIPFIIQDTHKFFGATDDEARKLLVEILNENNIGTYGTFEVGPTRQTVMGYDGQIIIGCFTEDIGDLPSNVLTIGVDNPLTAAKNAVAKISNHKSGKYFARFYQPDQDLPLYIIKTNVFKNSHGGIGFRLPIFGGKGKRMPTVKWIDNP